MMDWVFVLFVMFWHRMPVSCREMIDLDVVIPGVLSTLSVSSIGLSGPAFDVSLAKIQAELPDFNISHVYVYDEAIKECLAYQLEVQNLLAKWYYTVRKPGRMVVIITTGCVESAQLNQLAAAWNVFLMTSANSDAVLHDKTKSPTWVTTNLYPSSYYGDIVWQLLRKHNWTSMEILRDSNSGGLSGTYVLVANAVLALLKVQGLPAANQVYSANTTEKFNFRSFLSSFSTRNRVLLFLGPPTQLRILLITATQMNMTNGDYVYVSILPFPWRGYGNFSWQRGDPDDDIVREAYGSLLLVTLIDLTMNMPSDLISMMAQWNDRFRTVPFYQNPYLDIEPPLPQLTSTTAAIEIFGQVLHEVVQSAAFDPEDGQYLAQRMINRTFTTSAGNVTFDRNGERRPLLVTCSYFAQTARTFKPFLQSDIKEGQFRWRNVRPVLWHNGSRLPPSEPLCGFSGLSPVCHRLKTEYTILIVLLPIFVFFLGALISRTFAHHHQETWWILDDQFLGPSYRMFWHEGHEHCSY